MRLVPASDSAFLVVFDDAITDAAARDVRRLHPWLREAPIPGMVDVHPAYASVLVRFDPLRTDPLTMEAALRDRVARLSDRPEPASRTIEVRVRYGGEDGTDLADVARATGLAEREVIERHAGGDYDVRFLGFSPGFPYLAGLPASLFTPRRASPRRCVPAGSVAIAGAQAGIYPVASPGGWNLIGRTELVLFDPSRKPPALFSPGDRVRFVPMSAP